MRLCRIVPQFSLRAVDGPDVFINMASQALRRAATGPSGGSMSNLGEDSKNDAPESHSDKWEPSSPSEHRSATDAHRSTVGRSASEFDNSRPGVKSLRHPRRIEFYHRRHREIKNFEKKQDRIQHLRAISKEKEAYGQLGIAEAAAAEADRLETPWLASNIPIRPPTYASVSHGKDTPAKTVSDPHTKATGATLDIRQETRSLDVLNLKVGYAVDAQYALPEEVKAFILDQTTFCLYGVDKNQVTQIASNIRRIRPPEPYKGAGIRIVGETIKLKERKVK